MSTLFFKTKTIAYYMTQSVNQLLQSGVFSNAAWVNTNITLVSGQTDPSAGTTAFKATATAIDATLLQTITLQGTANRVFSIYLKRSVGSGNISLTLNGTTYTVTVITGAWVRYSITASASGIVNVGIKIAVSTDAVFLAWAQYEDGSVASTYSANTTTRFTITQVTDGDFPANTTRGCAYLDGKFFVGTPAADIYQSAGADDPSSWSATEFIGANIEPDTGVYLCKYLNYIMFLKGWSGSFYYDAANSTGSILSPVPNMTFNIGCASDGSVQEMAGTVVWMGKERNGEGRSIYRMNGTAPELISTPSVDKILMADSLATVYSWNCKIGSHVLYGLTLVTTGVTLVFDFSSGLWGFFTYVVSGADNTTITAIDAAGIVTAAAHPYSDGEIVNITGTGTFDGFAVATSVSTDNFTIQTTGTAFAGSATCNGYTETYFPIVASTSSGGTQWMQDISSGALYTLTQAAYKDASGSIAARIATTRFDGSPTRTGAVPTSRFKKCANVDVIGDKIDSTALIRWSDDDYVTYTNMRAIDLNLPRSVANRCGQFISRSFELLHVENTAFRVEALDVALK